ncbi:uncharacterized protein B0H64DRAFT_447426 [Chaetomium fimeti]|uniref:F-box domain-containing protein n=1 Tax=Chaetomium fimeti TaxID=1854472 RepID=A0AAE0H562_9PEZI|nr:hypothetical protein B0H64DRAFT_447426 [Chaetomium fimeti]
MSSPATTQAPNPLGATATPHQGHHPIFDLPLELLFMVASHLGNGSYLAFSLTSRGMHRILFEPLYTRDEDEVAATTTSTPSTTTTTTTTITSPSSNGETSAAPTTIPKTPTGTVPNRDESICADFFDCELQPHPRITNLHRAFYHGVTQRLRRPMELAEALGCQRPHLSFVVEDLWVMLPLYEAAADCDVGFTYFLLRRYAPLLRYSLGTGRMLHDVLLRALHARRQGGPCYWGVIYPLLDAVDHRHPFHHDFDDRLLKVMMRWGVPPCSDHGGSPSCGSCFLDLVEMAVSKRLVRFGGVSKDRLERWIDRLPAHLQNRVYDMLWKVRCSPLRWKTGNSQVGGSESEHSETNSSDSEGSQEHVED